MEAAASASTGGILQTAGVASILETDLTTEEYLLAAQAAVGAAWGYTNIGVANVESGNLNVRAVPSTDGKLVGKMPKDSACEVLETADGWAHIQSGEVDGYVSLEFLLTGPEGKLKAKELVHTVAVSNGDGLNVRDGASLDPFALGGQVFQIPKGEELEYLATEGEWVKVAIDDQTAYIAAEFVAIEEKLDTAITMTELLYGQGVSDVRVELVEYAKQFLGNRYVYGGSSLTKGTDCSGFKKFGVSLSHHAASQAKEGTKISASELQPGDLVFYGNSKGSINHVALYIGGGQVIHASSPSTGIKISKYNYRTPVKCVRVLQDWQENAVYKSSKVWYDIKVKVSRRSDLGHSDPVLVSGGYQNKGGKEHDFKGKEDGDHERVCQNAWRYRFTGGAGCSPDGKDPGADRTSEGEPQGSPLPPGNVEDGRTEKGPVRVPQEERY